MNGERGMAPAPVPADVGIVAALPIEVSDVIDGLKKVRKYQSATVPVIEGEYGGTVVAVATGGPGRRSARHAAEVLISGHRPRWIISAGFAGRSIRNSLATTSCCRTSWSTATVGATSSTVHRI